MTAARPFFRKKSDLAGMRLLPFTTVALAVVSLESLQVHGQVKLENRYDFLTSEVTAHDYTKKGICPAGVKLEECMLCYEKNICRASMVGFQTRVGRSDMTIPYPKTTATTSLVAGFIGAPTFVVSSSLFSPNPIQSNPIQPPPFPS